MPHLLRIEAVNLAACIDDTEDLSTRRGGSLMLLQAVQEMARRFSDRITAVKTGASTGLFELHPGQDAPALAEDKRYLTNGSRTEHVLALEGEIADILKKDTAASWLGRLDAAGIPAGTINDVKGALEHPQTAARHMVVETSTPNGTKLKVIGNPIKISGFSDPPTRAAAPALGQHRDAIVAELARDRK